MRLRAHRKLETVVALDKVENRVFTAEPPPLFDTRMEAVMHELGKPSAEKRGPPRDDYEHLLRMSASFYGDRSEESVKWAMLFVPEEFKKHLEKHVPRSNFETTRQWIVALKKEIDGKLLPMVKSRRPDPRGYTEAAANFLASDRIIEDSVIEERLDAAIDRALRRLLWLKTQK